MPEEAVETQELKERLDEAREREPAAGSWLMWLSLSTAIIAVLAAISALQSGGHANEAIVRKNDAVLHQSKADDAWAYYQSKGIEATFYSTQSLAAANPEVASRLAAEAEREKRQRAVIRRQAEGEESAVAEMNELSEHHLHVHHQFAKAVTAFQVAIALAAIAALVRRKPLWWLSLAVGVLGVVFFARGELGEQPSSSKEAAPPPSSSPPGAAPSD
jgi:hypothetical protein